MRDRIIAMGRSCSVKSRCTGDLVDDYERGPQSPHTGCVVKVPSQSFWWWRFLPTRLTRGDVGEPGGAGDEPSDGVDEQAALGSVGDEGVELVAGARSGEHHDQHDCGKVGRLGPAPRSGEEVIRRRAVRVQDGEGVVPLDVLGDLAPLTASSRTSRDSNAIDGANGWYSSRHHGFAVNASSSSRAEPEGAIPGASPFRSARCDAVDTRAQLPECRRQRAGHGSPDSSSCMASSWARISVEFLARGEALEVGSRGVQQLLGRLEADVLLLIRPDQLEERLNRGQAPIAELGHDRARAVALEMSGSRSVIAT